MMEMISSSKVMNPKTEQVEIMGHGKIVFYFHEKVGTIPTQPQEYQYVCRRSICHSH